VYNRLQIVRLLIGYGTMVDLMRIESILQFQAGIRVLVSSWAKLEPKDEGLHPSNSRPVLQCQDGNALKQSTQLVHHFPDSFTLAMLISVCVGSMSLLCLTCGTFIRKGTGMQLG
jgi:hypothetical protein